MVLKWALKILILVSLVLFTTGFAFLQNERYLLSWTDGSKLVLNEITKTSIGGFQFRNIADIPTDKRIGNTAVITNLVNQAHSNTYLYYNYVGPDNNQLLSKMTVSPSGQVLGDKLQTFKPGRSPYHVLQIWETEAGKRYLYLFKGTDFINVSLNASGDTAGPRKIIFNNPPNEVPLGGSISTASAAVQANELSGVEGSEVDDDDDDHGVDRVLIDPPSLQVSPPTELPPSILGYTETFEKIHGVEVNKTPFVVVGAGSSAQGNRILVTQAIRNLGAANQQSRIKTLVIDENGNPVGTPKSIVNPVSAPNAQAQSFQPLAIAPNGTFLVYTQFSAACRRQVIKIIRLNPNTGSKMGGAREVQGCSRSSANTVGSYGLNLWELP